MENKFLSFQDDRMAGIVPPLESHDDIGELRQQVDDLSFALISPLRSYNHNIAHSQWTLHSLDSHSFHSPRRGEDEEDMGLHSVPLPSKFNLANGDNIG